MTEATHWLWVPAADGRRLQRAPGHYSIPSVSLPALCAFAAAVCLYLSPHSHGGEGTEFRLCAEPKVPGSTLTLRYKLTLRNGTDSVLSTVLHAAAPVSRTTSQQCLSVKTSHPCRLVADDLGNQSLAFRFARVPPFGSKVVTITALVDMLAGSGVSREVATLPRTPVPRKQHPGSRASDIESLAARLKGRNQYETARRIHRWVASTVRYSGCWWESRGAAWALANRRGDCSDSSALFQSLCCAAGVPARRAVGFVCEGNAVLRESQFHEWAEFSDGTNWRLSDPQRRCFDRRESHYIAFRVHPDNDTNNSMLFFCDSEGINVELHR